MTDVEFANPIHHIQGPSLKATCIAYASLVFGVPLAGVTFTWGMWNGAWPLAIVIGAAAIVIPLVHVYRLAAIRRWGPVMGWIAGIVVWGGLFVGCISGSVTRARCGAYVLKSASFMRGLHMEVLKDLDAGRPLPVSLVFYFHNDPRNESVLGDHCSGGKYEDVKLGAYTLADYRTGRVDRQTIEQSIMEAGGPPVWEQMGRYTLCRDPAALAQFHARLIVGWEAPGPRPGGGSPDSFNVIYADNHVNLEQPEDGAQLLEGDAAARAKHSLPPLPDSFPVPVRRAPRGDAAQGGSSQSGFPSEAVAR